MSAEHLKLSQWAVVATMCGAMLGLGIASSPPQNSSYQIKNNLIDVSIVGAVSAPGTYRIPVNSTVRQALAQASLLAHANVQKCKWEARVRQGQVIRVVSNVKSPCVGSKPRKKGVIAAKVKGAKIDLKTLPGRKEEQQVVKKRKKSKKSDSSIVENSQV